MSNLYLRGRIPDGSKISIRIVESSGTPEGSFVGGARLLLESGREEIWSDADIHPGPKSKTLLSPKNYVWRVFVGFTSADVQKATIHAEIRKPNGDVFSTPYVYEVEGKNGDERRATIVAITLLDQ